METTKKEKPPTLHKVIESRFGSFKENGDVKVNKFLGWDRLFQGDINPDILVRGTQVYVFYTNVTLGEDLTSVHPSLTKGVTLKEVVLDPIFGDAAVQLPDGSKKRIRLVMRSVVFKALV